MRNGSEGQKPDGVVVQALPGRALLARREELVEIYRAVFTLPPYRESERAVALFGRMLSRHARRPGLKVVGALRPESQRLVGFAFGAASRPGEWWHDVVRNHLADEVAAEWMGWPFELVELALHPTYQGQGIGGRLHDSLLRDLDHGRAVLSTAAAETAATHLYRKRGWQQLAPPFSFPGNDTLYIILGLRLPLQGSR